MSSENEVSCVNCKDFCKSAKECSMCINYSNFIHWNTAKQKVLTATKPEKSSLSKVFMDTTEGISPTVYGPIPKVFIPLTQEQKDAISEGVSKIIHGTKFDSDKLDWTLMPWKELEETLEVLEFGAKKYSRDNWKHVEPARYERAAMRHLISYVTGEKLDPESGKSHLAHLMCNVLFLMWNDNEKSV